MPTLAPGRRPDRPVSTPARRRVRRGGFAAAAVLALAIGGCGGPTSDASAPAADTAPAAPPTGTVENAIEPVETIETIDTTTTAAVPTTVPTAAPTTVHATTAAAPPDASATAEDTGTAPASDPPVPPEPPDAAEDPPNVAEDPPNVAEDPPDVAEPAPTTTTVPLPRPEASTVEGLLALGRPLVIAHGGGDQDYPHSTIYAYWQSAAAGADILELDVQLTADGALIVQHDDTVDRTTETTGAVADLTLAEIQALDNAHWFVPGLWGDRTRPAGEYVFRGVRHGAVEPPPGFGVEDFRVATFREVAERFPHHVLDVEIKLQRGDGGQTDPGSGIAAAEVLAAEIAELGRQDSVIVACFNDEVLAAFQQLAPDVATTPATDELLAWWLAGEALPAHYRVFQVPFRYQGIEVVQRDLVDRLHGEGRQVWVWLSGTDVLETREFYVELLARGVDGVIAGRPAEAVTALAEAP